MQHSIKLNHFEFKPKVDLAVYENWGVDVLIWLDESFELAEWMYFYIADFFPI